MPGPERAWPAGLVAYKRTPDFTEASVPAGLLRRHATKPGVWAKLHIGAGRLIFRDLETNTEQILSPGVHCLIFPQADHKVAPLGPVRFFLEFHRAGP